MNRAEQIAEWIRPLQPTLGAEVGVRGGVTISHLLKTFGELVMYAIDPWEQQPGALEDYSKWDFDDIYQKYMGRVAGCEDRIIELREYSVSASANVEDKSLDFVFIDAQHDYESVKQDIAAWMPKIKKGGLISGHDYQRKFSGVIQAVDELLPKREVGSDTCWCYQI